jgi:DNA polymerase-4
LRRDGIRGRRVTLKLKLARALGGGRYPLVTRSQTLREATDDGATIAAAARQLLTRADPSIAIRLLGVSVSSLAAADGAQLALPTTDRDGARRARLNRAVDAIHARYGDDALRRGVSPTTRAGLSHGIKRGED